MLLNEVSLGKRLTQVELVGGRKPRNLSYLKLEADTGAYPLKTLSALGTAERFVLTARRW